jgi:mono/diheme cytochrome c family protein
VGFKAFGVAAIAVCASAVLLSGFLHPSVFAQSQSSTRDGVYTADQAAQGKLLYQKTCATCHGPALLGSGKNAPLVGDVFLGHWLDQSMADLFMKTNTSMPASAPGTMSPDETAQVLAYILSENKFQPGSKPLPADPDGLAAIRIDKP